MPQSGVAIVLMTTTGVDVARGTSTATADDYGLENYNFDEEWQTCIEKLTAQEVSMAAAARC